MSPARNVFLSLAVGLILSAPRAEAVFPTVAIKPVVLQQIHSPTTITFAPDGSGRLFVCDQPGKIYIIQNGMLLPTPFLNIANPSNASSSTPAGILQNNGPGPVITVGVGYNERGLLGLAFHPGYANPLSPGYRKFYVNYVKTFVSGVDAPPLGPLTGTNPGTITGSAGVSVIAEFQVSATNPNVALPASERRLLVYTQSQTNHNGGMVEFGPEIGPNGERYLYIGVGDGGSQQDNDLGHTGGNNTSPRPTNNLGNGQDKTRLFGKILRIDPLGTNGPGGQYGIPVDNPFVGAGGGVREEIYSFGMRNPWRFSWDWRPGSPTPKRMFCGDVGGDNVEEVDIITSGGNYGWRYKEGSEFPSFSSGALTNPMLDPGQGPYIEPIAQYAHPNTTNTSTTLPKLGVSVTGGFMYRGSAIPQLQGKYVFGDYGTTSGTTDGRLMGLEETAPLSGVFTLTQAIPFLGLAVGTSGAIAGKRILCFGEDESGEIYIGLKVTAGVLSLDGGYPSGGIYKIVPLESVNTTLAPSQDSTIFSENLPGPPPAITGYPADGQGYLYSGRTGPNYGPYMRRALVAFDVAAQLPTSAVIQSAQLQLWEIKQGPSAAGKTMSLHRVSETWGEGPSYNAFDQGYGAQVQTGDSTWVRRFYNTSSWTNAGGTFSGTPSATATVPSYAQMMMWGSTAQMVSDVQGWLNTPSSNAGWILIGDEGVNNTAIQFSSNQLGGVPPALVVTYGSAPTATHFETWLATYFPSNRFGQYVDPNGDDDGDGIGNQVEYAYAFSPVAGNPVGSGLQTSVQEVGDDTVCTISFRRDPLATDLTYELQTSGDLVNWNTIVVSTGGGDSSGTGFLGEGEIIGEEPVRLVYGQETLPTVSNPQRFVRLRITRAP